MPERIRSLAGQVPEDTLGAVTAESSHRKSELVMPALVADMTDGICDEPRRQ
jgi:hypothetical protein